MSVYLITYFLSDTCGCGENHSHDDSCECGDNHNHSHENDDFNLISKIKSLGAWAQFMPEGFLVKSTSSANEILAELKNVSNSGDIIFVSKIDSDSCACVNPSVVDWISK